MANFFPDNGFTANTLIQKAQSHRPEVGYIPKDRDGRLAA